MLAGTRIPRREEVGDESVNQRLGTASADADKSNDRKERSERQLQSQRHDRERAQQKAGGNHRLRAEAVGEARDDDRPESRGTVQHQQKGQRPLGVETRPQHEFGQPRIK